MQKCFFARVATALALAVLPLTLFSKTDSVPAGFIPVEYIESTGTQFINTLLTAGNSMSLDMQIETTGTTSGERAFFGTTWSVNQYLLFSQGGYFKFAGDGAAICAIDANTPYTITAGGGKVTVLNEKTGVESSVSGKNFGGGSGWCIFAHNRAPDNEKGIFRLRSAKVWMEDELVRDFHPCYTNTADGGEVIGLYDTANDVFYTNAGTGVFLRGAEVADTILVTGSPIAVGTPVSTRLSGYGKYPFAPGETVTTTVTDETGTDGSTRWTLRGWTLIEKLADGTVVATTSSDESNKTTCSVTCRQGCLYELDWKWKVEHLVTVSADVGLTASASAQWVEHGDSVTLTATAAGDKDFVRWTGDVTGVDALSPTFTTTVTGPMTLAAKTPAAVYYVAPDSTGKGSSWADAFGSIQDAVTAAGTAADGAIVYLKAGNYFQTAAVTATGVGPLTIRGGYTGEGLATGGTTVVARENGAAQCNLFSFSGSTVTLDSLVISNGYTASVYYGQGVALMNACTASLVNCRFLDNGNGNVDADSDHFGGAVGIQNGKIRIVDCEFARNTYHDSGSNVKPLGGAVGMTGDANSSILIRNCSFSKNWTRSVHARASGGGAIGFRNVPSVRVENCTFDGNYARTWGSGGDLHGGGQPGPYGGVAHISGVARAEFSDCLFRTNWLAEARLGVFVGNGGLIYLTGSTLVMNRCASYMAGYSGYASNTGVGNCSCGDISVRGGSSLYMTNVLLGATYNGYAIVNDGGRVEAVNCTIAGTKGFTTYRTSHAYVQNSGSASFRNCILWNNHDGDMTISSGDEPVFEYCVTQSAHAGPGNTTDDPLFGDEVYFHPQSKAGRYDGGWFDGGSWVTTDEATSAAIDAGDPDIPYADEPQPNLYRVNIGYDGGTAVASKSVVGSAPVPAENTLGIYAYEATDISPDGATLRADVNSTGGGANPTVTVAWDTEDKGMTLAGWTNSQTLGEQAPWSHATYRLSGVTGTIYYRFFATNAGGTAVSDPVRSFAVAVLPTIVYDTDENPVSHRYHLSARVNATLSSDGGSPTTVRVRWWPTDDAGRVTLTQANFGLPIDSGSAVAVDLTGLEAGVSYTYELLAENGAGVVTLARKVFTTVPKTTPLVLYAGSAMTGRGDGDGAANAAGDLQALLDSAVYSGDEIRILAGTNTLTAALVVKNNPGLVIRGGYTGVGEDRSGVTVLRRDPAGSRKMRILEVSASTITLDSLTISDARYSYPGTFYAQGVALLGGCDTTITNCTFLRNGSGMSSEGDVPSYGGAIGAQNGTLRVYDSTFEGNCVQGGGGKINGLGGAIGMTGTTGSSADIRRCSFTANFTQSVHSRDYGGGALGFRSVPDINIEGCTFRTNFCRQSSGSGSHTGQPFPHGGTFYIYDSANVRISDCTVLGSWSSQYQSAQYNSFGGTAWFQSSTVAMNRVVVYGAGYNEYAASTDVGGHVSGSIDISGGALYMTNVLNGALYSGPALAAYNSAKVEAVNCTFAGARGLRNKPGYGYVQVKASATFRNCIFWNNKAGDFQFVDGTQPVFDYCITETLRDGRGNTTNDPLFGDEVYFHPQSKAGRYDGGWFDGGSWVTTDEATSAAIDAGHPNISYADEPQPNLSRVNIGYDGGTETASKSVCGTDPVVKDDELMIFAYAATGEGAEGATVSAHVASTGGAENPNVKVVWGDSDKGANSVSDWGANVADLGVREPWALVEYRIAGITGYNTVWYRFVAENAKGVVWSDPVRSFKIAKPPTIAYADDADVVTHLYRTGARIHANLADNGGVDTIVRLIYWPVADYSAPVTVVVNDGLACPLGPVTIATDELTPGTEYAYVIEAENSVDVVRLAEKRFTTVADAAKLTLVGGPANVGHGDGATFDHPSGELQMLLDALYRPGDELLLMEGTNIVADTLLVSNHEGLLIKGGYTAGGETREGVSMIRRNSALPKPHRVFTVTASKIGFDQVTVSEGQYNEGGDCYGMGVALLSGCNAAFTNCVFRNNGCNDTNEKMTYGAAIGAQNGTLEIVDCVFTNNSVKGGGNNVRPCGGAVGATGARVRITGSTFTRNWVQHVHARYYGGGALGFRGCPSVEIDHCTFLTNWSYSGGSGNNGYYTPQKDHGPYGGTIYFGNATAATIADCTFRGGWNASYNSDTPTWGWGGVLCVADRAKVALVRTKFLGTGACDSWYTAAPHFCSGSIDVKDSGSALYMTNVLHAGAVRGPCLGNNGGTIDAVNCTFAGAIGEGSQPSAAYVQYGSSGVTTFRNCIVWGNKGGYLYAGNGGTPTATYCDLQGTDPDAEKGIISADPRFRNPSVYDYSLRSRSPCGNAGDKTGIPRTEKDIDGNPRYKGKIDMGCYESRGDPFCIRIY